MLFRSEACQQALRHYWATRDQQRFGWSLERYLFLLHDYRARFASDQPRPLPLIVLSREWQREDGTSEREEHGLFWLRPGLLIRERAMRHTCA